MCGSEADSRQLRLTRDINTKSWSDKNYSKKTYEKNNYKRSRRVCEISFNEKLTAEKELMRPLTLVHQLSPAADNNNLTDSMVRCDKHLWFGAAYNTNVRTFYGH